MDHKLRIIMRLDVDRASTVLAISGCLTEKSYKALFPIIRRTTSVFAGTAVVIDLSGAKHIEASALKQLRQFSGFGPASGVRTEFVVPAQLPACPALAKSHALLESVAS